MDLRGPCYGLRSFTCWRRLTSFPGKRKLVETRLGGSVAVVNAQFFVFVKSVPNP